MMTQIDISEHHDGRFKLCVSTRASEIHKYQNSGIFVYVDKYEIKQMSSCSYNVKGFCGKNDIVVFDSFVRDCKVW